MGTVLITSRSFSSGSLDLIGRLRSAGHRVLTGSSAHHTAELGSALAEADAWIAGTGPINSAHFELAPRLRIVARYGVGYDAVDTVEAARRGVTVSNTPGANSEAVADHAVGLLLAVLRGTTDGDRRVRRGDWSVHRGRQLGALAVGIVGFGRIGHAVAQRLSGFGSRLFASDPALSVAEISAAGATRMTLAAMGRHCDVVTLHSSGGGTLIDDEWLRGVRPGLVLVNTARPELVDESAVADALTTGILGGYAADTLRGDTGGGWSPLLAPELAARVVVTPHLGAQTVEAIDQMGEIAVRNVVAVLSGQPALHPVPPSNGSATP